LVALESVFWVSIKVLHIRNQETTPCSNSKWHQLIVFALGLRHSYSRQTWKSCSPLWQISCHIFQLCTVGSTSGVRPLFVDFLFLKTANPNLRKNRKKEKTTKTTTNIDSCQWVFCFLKFGQIWDFISTHFLNLNNKVSFCSVIFLSNGSFKFLYWSQISHKTSSPIQLIVAKSWMFNCFVVYRLFLVLFPPLILFISKRSLINNKLTSSVLRQKGILILDVFLFIVYMFFNIYSYDSIFFSKRSLRNNKLTNSGLRQKELDVLHIYLRQLSHISSCSAMSQS